MPRRGDGRNGASLGDDEPYPHGDELRISGERRPGETYPEAEARMRAEYWGRYPNGDAILTVR
jgi:hypothetical protein